VKKAAWSVLSQLPSSHVRSRVHSRRLLLILPLLTLIISASNFIYPFIVSQNISSLYIITADLCAAQVSRLILNLLEANCPLDESIDSSTIESLRFRHSESTRDTESNIS